MLEAQRSVGRFEILEEIGRGGMAVVYLARQTDLGRQVALKELGSFHASEQAFAERFVLESRVVGSLNHPNVVTAYDYFEHEGTPYIAMEYVEGGALRRWMRTLSLAQVAGVFEGVLAGLAHAAKRGIVHRDLKPENLMVTGDGTIKIGDFGIAKALNQATVGRLLTATGTTVGTPTYMAPEQAMGQDVGPWTDLYSVGVIAYEMLIGRVPFHHVDTPMAILMSHVNEPIPAPRSVRPDLDPELASWIERLLAKKPDDRIQGAHRAWEELEEIVIRILGPRWRREARLVEPVAPGVVTSDQPLTPAPFDPESEDELDTTAGPRRAEPAQVPPEAAATRPPQETISARAGDELPVADRRAPAREGDSDRARCGNRFRCSRGRGLRACVVRFGRRSEAQPSTTHRHSHDSNGDRARTASSSTAARSACAKHVGRGDADVRIGDDQVRPFSPGSGELRRDRPKARRRVGPRVDRAARPRVRDREQCAGRSRAPPARSPQPSHRESVRST